jgi:hypothetical protein
MVTVITLDPLMKAHRVKILDDEKQETLSEADMKSISTADIVIAGAAESAMIIRIGPGRVRVVFFKSDPPRFDDLNELVDDRLLRRRDDSTWVDAGAFSTSKSFPSLIAPGCFTLFGAFGVLLAIEMVGQRGKSAISVMLFLVLWTVLGALWLRSVIRKRKALKPRAADWKGE